MWGVWGLGLKGLGFSSYERFGFLCPPGGWDWKSSVLRMEKKMETTIVYWGYIGENGEENGNYCSMSGLYRG